MINSVQKKVLILALFAGELMMKSGAEISRVEDTIVRICKACRIDYVECFATPTGVFLSVDSGEADADMHTFVKRIKGSEIDLSRISDVNTFSRVFTTTDLSIDDGFEELRRIRAKKSYSMLTRLIGAILVGAFFCPIYKGSFRDMFVAGALSGVAYLISYAIQKLKIQDFVRIFICCAAAAGLVLGAAALSLSESISPVIVATTTIFLPGVAITNAARDLLSGDMIAGVARLAEAMLAAVAIAGGVGIGIKIWMSFGGELVRDHTVAFAPPWFLLFGFFSTFGFGLLFNAPKKHILTLSAIGGAGMFILVFMMGSFGLIGASFLGTCAIAILAEIASRAGKDATTIFIIPGIIPFVPGAPLYETMSSILVGNYSDAVESGVQAFMIAGAIALALVIVATGARLLLAFIRRIRRPGTDL
ncbi:hypothetical protein AGMMS49983_08450 [Clostridia bacterium]|nr:hypothetical protein AGMMS49983_08450 [Clostridia bacterium]